MHLKDDILAMWKSRDVRKTSSLGPMVHLFCGLQESGIYPGKKLLFLEGLQPPSGVLCGPGGGGGMSAVSSSFFRPLAPPPRIPSMSRLSPYIQELLPTSFPMMNLPTGYNFDPITGWPLKVSTPDIFSWSFPAMGYFTPNLYQPMCHRSVKLARAEPGGMSTSS